MVGIGAVPGDGEHLDRRIHVQVVLLGGDGDRLDAACQHRMVGLFRDGAHVEVVNSRAWCTNWPPVII